MPGSERTSWTLLGTLREDVSTDQAIDPELAAQLVEHLEAIEWGAEGRVAILVETPRPHRHARRAEVTVVEGKGFSGDHAEKSFYMGAYVPGREVSAIAAEVLLVFGVDPVVVGDNLITEGVDLGRLEEGDLLQAGDVLLERSARAHRPCRTFRNRTSPEAFAAVSRERYRGALFIVREGGTIREGDPVTIRRVS